MSVNNEELLAAVDKLRALKLIKRDSDLAMELGYSRGIVSEYLNNKKDVSDIFMVKLYNKYPQVKKSEKNSQKPNDHSFQSNATALDGNDYHVMMVPLVNKYAYAGYAAGFGDDEYVEELPKVPLMVDREHKGIYRAFEVRGDSMDNGLAGSYREGYILYGREIPKHYWRDKLHLRKWQVFIIVTKTDGILFKEITKHDTVKGTITLHSWNEEYQDIEMHLDDVAQLLNVVQASFK